MEEKLLKIESFQCENCLNVDFECLSMEDLTENDKKLRKSSFCDAFYSEMGEKLQPFAHRL